MLALAALALLAAGCATPHDVAPGREWGAARLAAADVTSEQARDIGWCTDSFARIDEAVARAGVRDAQAAPIAGFPHLRTTRFLAAMGQRIGPTDDAAFAYWTDWLAETARRARRVELANLPADARAALGRRLGDRPAAVIERCTAVLRAADRGRRRARESLVATVHVPDDYIDALRVAGIYPLTSLPVLVLFERWKDRNLGNFSRPKGAAKSDGNVVRYAPNADAPLSSPERIAALLGRAADNPIGVPRPDAAALRQIASTFAPVYAVETAGDDDRIGRPVLRDAGPPDIDIATPFVYVQPSWTLFGGVPLLQISYLAWFPRRTSAGSFDIQSGRLDGLIWRVTIGRDGRPVVYDTIHPCGCYHLFFPVPPTRLKDPPRDEPGEGTVVPADGPLPGAGERVVLHLAAGNHYLQRISVADNDSGPAVRYRFADMDELRTLPLPGGGSRSLYDADGLVPGTERTERFLLWPMGVPSAGQMRQWGNHATAFVGRRQFDDPVLLDKAFRR